MKKLFAIFFAVSSTVIIYSTNRVVYSENFEAATSETTAGTTLIGNAMAKAYDGGGGVWTVDLETVNPISGTKSAHFNIQNNGTQNWALQFRIDSKFPVIGGLQYKTTFKIKSSVPNTLLFRVQARADFTETLQLTGGNTVQEFSVIATMNTSGSNAVFWINFSTPAVPGEIWLDDFVIEELNSPSSVGDNQSDDVKIWSESKKIIIESVDNGVADIFNLRGQKIATSDLSVSQKAVIAIPENEHCVIVKVFSEKNILKTVKVRLN